MISVTRALQVISQSYGPNSDVIEAAAIRGTAVHDACTAYALGLFPVLNDEIEGYFQSFRDWWDAHVDRVAMEPEEELKDESWGSAAIRIFPC